MNRVQFSQTEVLRREAKGFEPLKVLYIGAL